MKLQELHSQFRMLAKRAGALESEIAQLRVKFENVPEEYVELVRDVTELELQHVNESCLRIWGPLGCLEMDEAYNISARMPGAIPIGDNGGGSVLFYLIGNDGLGLNIVGYGSLVVEDATRVASNLGELLIQARGVASLR